MENVIQISQGPINYGTIIAASVSFDFLDDQFVIISLNENRFLI